MAEPTTQLAGSSGLAGHKGGDGADPALVESIGEPALRLDIRALTPGIDGGGVMAERVRR